MPTYIYRERSARLDSKTRFFRELLHRACYQTGRLPTCSNHLQDVEGIVDGQGGSGVRHLACP